MLIRGNGTLIEGTTRPGEGGALALDTCSCALSMVETILAAPRLYGKEFLMRYTYLMFIPAMTLFSCTSDRPLETVDQLDIEKYAGTWYEISRLPNSFEQGLKCVTATYSLRDDGKIAVLNKGHETDNPSKIDEANGTAWIPDPAYPGRLKVRFFWPFSGDYHVIRLDPQYQFVLVGDPSRKYLWILSRTPDLDPAIVSDLKETAREMGFDIAQMIDVEHDC